MAAGDIRVMTLVGATTHRPPVGRLELIKYAYGSQMGITDGSDTVTFAARDDGNGAVNAAGLLLSNDLYVSVAANRRLYLVTVEIGSTEGITGHIFTGFHRPAVDTQKWVLNALPIASDSHLYLGTNANREEVRVVNSSGVISNPSQRVYPAVIDNTNYVWCTTTSLPTGAVTVAQRAKGYVTLMDV